MKALPKSIQFSYAAKRVIQAYKSAYKLISLAKIYRLQPITSVLV